MPRPRVGLFVRAKRGDPGFVKPYQNVARGWQAVHRGVDMMAAGLKAIEGMGTREKFTASAGDYVTMETLTAAIREAVKAEIAVAEAMGLNDAGAANEGVPVVGSGIPLEDVKRAHILGVLEACGRNITQAAAILKMDKTTLSRNVKGYKEVGIGY